MNDIDKLIKSILILLFLVSFFMLLFHRIKHKNSGYQKFEYYLKGKTDFGDEIFMLNFVFIFAFTIGCIVLFGYLFSLLIF